MTSSSSCPSTLALERFAAGEVTRADLKAHLAGCEKCSARLRKMDELLHEFSQSSASLDARSGLRRADRRWKRRAMLATLVPIAAAAAVIATLPSLLVAKPPPVIAVAKPPAPPPAAVQGRAVPGDLLEPRGTAPAPRLKEISLRGQTVGFGTGVLEGAATADAPSRPFVLKHTEVHADLTGFVSSVTVTQEFENPFDRPVEAIYVFPLPDDAAVDEMQLTAGGRVIRATIQKREQARRMYEEAKSQGRRAALLDQERPNVFTQSVANLMPRDRVKVSLRYVAPLKYDDGEYTFNFPMTVAPRFMPGGELAGESQGSGTARDTDGVLDGVLDASRVSPPLERSGRDIAVTVNLVAGAPVEELKSVSHRMRVSRGDGVQVVTLDAADRVPNKDFILRWRVTGTAKRAAVIASGGPGGTFALMVLPQDREAQAPPLPKEMVFVIDTSCSMAGPPLAAAKRAMTSAMEQMNPDDTFMLIDFADRASAFHDAPLANTPQNVARAKAYLDALPASGGTNQLAGLLRALQLRGDGKRLREVLLMTDGFIGNENEILAAAEMNLGNARVFGFGIGSSVNHYLLSRLSQVGRGFYQYVRPGEDPEAAIERFVRRIGKPMLSDLSLEWSGVEVLDVLPRRVPDLFDAQPVVLVGRYRNPGRGAVVLRGMRNGGSEELKVELELPAAQGSAPGLSSLWARARVEELDMMQHAGETADVVREITTLGLEHHLVTKYTSFVAVDDRRVAERPELTVPVANEPADGTRIAGGDGKMGWSGAQPVYKVPPPAPAKPEPPVTRANTPEEEKRGSDDEFAAAFGTGGRTVESSELRKSTYIPPAPGQGGNIADSLGQADIMEVVKSNIGAIHACLEEQRQRDPKTSGKLVMRWTIRPDGTVTKVEIVSREFASTWIAGCIGGLIKSWRFPKHRIQGEPVVFPFTFKF